MNKAQRKRVQERHRKQVALQKRIEKEIRKLEKEVK